MKVAIVGCGLIGQKRARTLGGEARLAWCVDSDAARARALASGSEGCRSGTDLREALGDDVSAVVVATSHDALAKVTAAAIESGKHVLVEKPAARHVDELRELQAAADRKGVRVHVGFNHRRDFA